MISFENRCCREFRARHGKSGNAFEARQKVGMETGTDLRQNIRQIGSSAGAHGVELPIILGACRIRECQIA